MVEDLTFRSLGLCYYRLSPILTTRFIASLIKADAAARGSSLSRNGSNEDRDPSTLRFNPPASGRFAGSLGGHIFTITGSGDGEEDNDCEITDSGSTDREDPNV